MRAYLIDPFIQKITEVETDASLDDILAKLHCSVIQGAYPIDSQGDMLYLDEEGKFKPDQRYFACLTYPGDVLGGRALWIGQGSAGYNASARTPLETVRKWIGWTNVRGPIL
jgi:hypothetical protein